MFPEERSPVVLILQYNNVDYAGIQLPTPPTAMETMRSATFKTKRVSAATSSAAVIQVDSNAGVGGQGRCGPTTCHNQHHYDFCDYYDCCTMSILPTVNISFSGGGGCGFGSLLFPDSYKSYDPRKYGKGTYGLELVWAIQVNPTVYPALCSSGLNNLTQSADYACSQTAVTCNNVSLDEPTPFTGYYCTCNEGYDGDGYRNGSSCLDVDECSNSTLNDCVAGACKNTQGSYTCICPDGLRGDGYKTGKGCEGSKNKTLKIALGVTGGFLIILSIAGLFFYRIYRKRERERLAEHEHMSRMEVLREMQTQGGAKVCKLFTLEELTKATSNFEEQNVVGTGGFGKIHKGTLDDGTQVAVKSAKRDVGGGRDDTQQFINEVTILSTVNHTNLVKLLGCCLETKVPILVYEFISNGSLQDYIRQTRTLSAQKSESYDRAAKSLDWDQRLRIAVGSAAALSYLHSGTSIPICHRDVKSANILLDNKLVAKVADFGLSKFVPPDIEDTHLSTAIQGTPGYVDPETFETFKITDKSDVYSFGVVLLELLTGEKSLDLSRAAPDRNLALRSRRLLKFGLFEDAIDATLNASSNTKMLEEIHHVTELAMECLERQGGNRPTMRQVEARLRLLSDSTKTRPPRSHSWGADEEFMVPIAYNGTTDSSSITTGMFTNSEDPAYSTKSTVDERWMS